MKSTYKPTYQLIAYVVLLSLFLQSCGNFSNQPTPGSYKAKVEVPSLSKRMDIASLVDQEFTAEKGYLVTFHEQDGRLQADLRIDATQKEPNYTNLPVVLAKDISLAELSHLSKPIQQRRIQIELSSTGQPSRIVVTRGGLKGGMMEGDGEKGEKEKTPLERLESAYKRLRLNKFLPVISQGEITLHYDKRLGAGGGGSVYQATYQDDIVAAKVLHASNEETLAVFQKEAIIMANHRHNNIVSFLGFCPGYNALVMEYVAGGSLWSLLKDKTKDIPWLYRHQIALDIAEGLNYLHDCGIVHGDLKSENILLGDNGQAKITDFGISALKNENSSFGTLITGTLRWMAPDIILSDRNSKAGDVYSYGMILWQLGTRELPFALLNGFALINHIKAGNLEKITEDTSPQIRQVIESCWLPTLQRPTMRQVRHLLEAGHPDFIDQGKQEKEELLESLSNQKEELLNQLKKLGKEQEELTSHLGNLSKQKEELASRLEKISKEKKEIISELERSGKDKGELLGQVAKLGIEKEELVSQLGNLDQEKEELVGHLKIFSDEKKELINQLEKLKQELEAEKKICVEQKELIDRLQKVKPALEGVKGSKPEKKEKEKEQELPTVKLNQLIKEKEDEQGFDATELEGMIAKWPRGNEILNQLKSTRKGRIVILSNDYKSLNTDQLSTLFKHPHFKKVILQLRRIGDSDIQKLAKVLPQSQIHALDLGYNNIGDEGSIKLAEALPATQIHTLYLSENNENNIDDEGASKLAEALPATQIHTLYLSSNNIGKETQIFLKKKFPKINFNLIFS